MLARAYKLFLLMPNYNSYQSLSLDFRLLHRLIPCL